MAILNNLIVNGSSRFLNDAYFNILAADTGRFNKLATKVLGNDGETITVHGLMDVQGELHTKSWSNSNIATIDESFFICPTLKVTETGSTSNGLTITQSGNTWSVQITSSSAVVTNSVYTMDSSGTVTTTGTWTLGSKVAITGEILVNNEWLPLGTLRGIITARSSDLKSVTISNITDGYSSSNNILNTIGVQSNVKHRNIKISLYEWTLSDSSTPTTATTNPIGIYMTALGDGTGQTMIDIYGGQEPSGTTYKGLAKPYVRIGNLSGLSNLSVGGQNPKGWGIYTSNGYFEGTIAARRGYIGNNTKYWTIGTSGTNSTIFSGPTTVSATGTAGTYLGTDGFLNTASSSVYAQITNGILTAKGVDITGKITANSGVIGGWNIGTDTNKSLYSGGSATAPVPAASTVILSKGVTSSTAVGGSSGSKTWMITAGTGFGVTTAGAMYANSGYIANWKIESNDLVTGTWGTDNSAMLCTGTSSAKSIGGSGNISGWVFTAGANFGVTKTGALYANSANITGTIDATSFTAKSYSGNTLKRKMSLGADGLKLMDGSGVILSQIDGSASTIGKTSGNNYNINITGTTIDLRYNANVLNRINSGGMVLYDGYGIDDNNIIAQFGASGAQIGLVGKSRANIDFHSMKFIDANGNSYFIANDLRDASGLSIIKQAFTVTRTMYDNSGIIYPIYTPVTQIVDVVDEDGESWLEEVSIDLKNAGTTNEYFDISTQHNDSGIQLTIIYKSTSVAYNYLLGTYKVGGNAGPYSTVIGKNNEASGVASIAEGANTSAKGFGCHAEGVGTLATYLTDYAQQVGAHAEGINSKASGLGAHAEGYDTRATSKGHAQNEGTCANMIAQTAIGTYNTIDISPTTTHPNQQNSYGKYALIIGNGTGDSDNARSNALTVDWGGNVEAAGALFANGAEFSKKANNHIVIGGYHVCWGLESISHTAAGYKEVQVTLPYTYTSSPACFTSLGNRPTGGAARTSYATQSNLAGNKIYVGSYATGSVTAYVNWMTIGV